LSPLKCFWVIIEKFFIIKALRLIDFKKMEANLTFTNCSNWLYRCVFGMYRFRNLLTFSFKDLKRACVTFTFEAFFVS
jgi:hypothetical protein